MTVHNLLHQHLSVHYLQTNGVLLKVNQPPLPFSLLYMNVKRLWIMEVKSVLCFLISAKPSTYQPLLHKLFHLQVNPFLLMWIHNYLSNRSQSVVLDGAQSNPLPVVSGVPQGSVLGPLLFLVYINGASKAALHSKIAMYADDIALYSIIKNPRDYTYLQRDITSLC